MKQLVDIFESIFDKNKDHLENHIIFDDPNSAFNKEWAVQISPENAHKFNIENNILHIGGEYINDTSTIYIDCKIPLTDYFSSIRGIYTKGNLQINGKKLDPSILGLTISAHGHINLQNILKINNINFKGESNSIISLYHCGILENCTMNGIKTLYLDTIRINMFKNCNAPDLTKIFIEKSGLFKRGWPKLEKLIDWNQLVPPTNLRTRQTISLNPQSLSKIASILKYSTKYSWGRVIEIPTVVPCNKIVEYLFPGCNFPKLSMIRVVDDIIVLKIHPISNLIKIYKK